MASAKEYYQNNTEQVKSARRNYYENNKKTIYPKSLAYSKKHREENPEMYRMYYIKYRARKRSLPDTLTSEETEGIVEYFHGECSICSGAFEHLDHFIPLSSGYGGTTLENIVPMCGSCNKSKGAKNPFEWAKTLTQKDRERFDSLVEYLTELNGIAAVEDYEAHVYQCFN